jgi:hypothetical protein
MRQTETTVVDGEARVLRLELPADRDGLGVHVERMQAALWPELCEDPARVPAAAEGPVDIQAIRIRQDLRSGAVSAQRPVTAPQGVPVRRCRTALSDCN